MYGYRQGHENGLLTNLNSISSSMSSLDTIGQSTTNNRASNDNLITLRSHSIASTSLLWNNNKNGTGNKDDRYSSVKANGTLMQNGVSGRHPGSEIYRNGGIRKSSGSALNFTLVPLLLLTIVRQVIDFLGQVWLQILINFFTIIFLIVALFGIKQRRISYLSLFSIWALFIAAWNLVIICIHTKIRDLGINEDALSLYTGTTSWWRSHGPGCLPYNISSIPPSISIIQQNLITTGCLLDYHAIEAVQAALHASLSFLSTLICCCLVSSIWRNTTYNQAKASDKLLRLTNIMNHERSKINPDPCPSRAGSRYANTAGSNLGNTASLRRANRTGSRASQHSVGSTRSNRRRQRQSVSGATPRGSTSSQKYGSLSSRRSTSKRGRRSDVSSVTYGTTGCGDRAAGTSQRTRLSSLSSADYLPSYQPPNSSGANRLSSYGEISSIDSYNNQTGQKKMRNPHHTNPAYTSSRTSIVDKSLVPNNGHQNNYDDLSYIYGSEKLYGTASNINGKRSKQQIYNRTGTLEKRNGVVPQKIHAETYGDAKSKISMTNGSSFAAANPPGPISRPQLDNTDPSRVTEVNNNHIYQDNNLDNRMHQHSNGNMPPTNGYSFDNRSQQNQAYSRHMPIYSNNLSSNGNQGETPI